MPVVCLLGPTASGKTTLALELAELLNAEIVSVDSALVYRGMDIGTAKPSLDEQRRVVHHLIDIVDPDVAYSAARFAEDARIAIDKIQQSGKHALLVGGTFLYYKALVEGLAPLPEADTRVRKQLVEEMAELGSAALHAELEVVDPQAAARIHRNDPQRLLRALEVYRLTGRPLSDLQAQTHPVLKEPVVTFALMPESRAWLHHRIEARLEMMEAAGFLEEVRGLAARGLPRELPALKSVGYRQVLEALDAGDLTQWKHKALVATRQLAKRQLTWLRGMEGIKRIVCDQLTLQQQLDQIRDGLQSSHNA